MDQCASPRVDVESWGCVWVRHEVRASLGSDPYVHRFITVLVRPTDSWINCTFMHASRSGASVGVDALALGVRC